MNTLVLSKVSPHRADAGAKLAVTSDLAALCALRHRVTLVAWRHSTDDVGEITGPDHVLYADARPGSLLLRAGRAIVSGLPAAVERYYSPVAKELLRAAVRLSRPDLVIVEEVALAGWIPLLREIAPAARIVLRSHDAMRPATAAVLGSMRGLKQAVYRIEAARACALEGKGAREADAVWTITEPDRLSYQHDFPGTPAWHVPVALDASRLSEIAGSPGDPDALLHIGTIDTKKAPGMRRFLSQVWPVLHAANPRARLYVAGRNPAFLPLTGPGVFAVGYVEDDLPWFRRAQYVINSQTVASGITLKTLMCFAAQRTLLSAVGGAQGMAIHPGRHYWELERLTSADAAAEFWKQLDRSRAMAVKGHEWLERNHSPAAAIAAMGGALSSGVAEKEMTTCAE